MATTCDPLVSSFILLLGVCSFRVILCEEVGVDSQTLHAAHSINSSQNLNSDASDKASTEASPSSSSSNKYTDVHFSEQPVLREYRESTLRESDFYQPPRRFSQQQSPYQSPYFVYTPRIYLEPVHIDELANASRQIVGQLLSGASEAFHNLLNQPRSRASLGPVKMLNGENIMATASRLLPTATKLLAPLNSPSRLLPHTHMDMSRRQEASENFNQTDTLASASGIDQVNYEEEGQKLRHDIVAKVGHLQTVLTTAVEVSKERRDLITLRILERTNFRLGQAKERADRILSQPANSVLAVRTLYAINQGINGIHSFLHGLLDRINISNVRFNVKLTDPVKEKEPLLKDANQTSLDSQQDETQTKIITTNNN